ncbi:hypothetical protein GGI07_001249 [Coemansia sp. Benny D115]|nr:hypothetical protein GGI07_001249 [Coemansia sp. Benny D115]
MELLELPESWPKDETALDLFDLLNQFKTDVFANKDSHPPYRYRFCIGEFTHRTVLMQAVTRNGGDALGVHEIEKADFIIDYDDKLLQENQGTRARICPPRFIYDCLMAGQMLSPSIYGDPNYPSVSNVLNLEANRAAQQVSKTHAKHESGATPHHFDEEVLDAEDRFMESMLSSQSRNISELASYTLNSPGSQSTYSQAFSDSDYRIKKKLDSSSRDLRELLSADSISKSFTEGRTNNSTSMRPPRTQPAWLQGRSQYQPSKLNNTSKALSLADTQSITSAGSDSGATIPKRAALISSASKSFKAARDFFESSSPVLNSSPPVVARALPRSAGRLGAKKSSNGDSARSNNSGFWRSPTPTNPMQLDARTGGHNRMLSMDDMEKTHLAPSAPEFTIPAGPERPAASMLSPSQKKDSSIVLDADILNFDPDVSSDEEYPDPNSLLADRGGMSQSMSTNGSMGLGLELGLESSPATLPKEAVGNGKDSGDFIEDEHMDEGKEGAQSADAGLDDKLESTIPKLGKRRRATNSEKQYDQQPQPVIVDKAHNLVKVADTQSVSPTPSEENSLSAPSSVGAFAYGDQMMTPPRNRLKKPAIRVRPWSSNKRIRMSTSESPEPSQNDMGLSTPSFVPISAPAKLSSTGSMGANKWFSEQQVGESSPTARVLQSGQSSNLPAYHLDSEMESATILPAVVSLDHSEEIAQPSLSSDTTQSTQPIGGSSQDQGQSGLYSREDSHSVSDSEDVDRSIAIGDATGESGHGSDVAVVAVDENGDGGESQFDDFSELQDSNDDQASYPVGTQDSFESDEESNQTDELMGTFSARNVPMDQGEAAETIDVDVDVNVHVDVDEQGPTSPIAATQDALDTDSVELTGEDINVADMNTDGDNDNKEKEQEQEQEEENADNTEDANQEEEEEEIEEVEIEEDQGASADVSVIVRSDPVNETDTYSENSDDIVFRMDKDSGEQTMSPEEPLQGPSEASQENNGQPSNDADVLPEDDRADGATAYLGPQKTPSPQRGTRMLTRSARRALVQRSASLADRMADCKITRGSATEPQPSRQRRLSSNQPMSTCQRLALIVERQQAGRSGHSETITPSGNSQRAFSLSNVESAVNSAGEPELDDDERLQYVRWVKGMIEGTETTARDALRVLYFCTGSWENAYKYIAYGPSSISERHYWNAADDAVLMDGTAPVAKIAELQRRRGSAEVRRRLLFLNTFHKTGPGYE